MENEEGDEMNFVEMLQTVSIVVASAGSSCTVLLFSRIDPRLVGLANSRMNRLHARGISVPGVLGSLEKTRTILLVLWLACLVNEISADPTSVTLLGIGVVCFAGAGFLLFRAIIRIRELEADDSTYETETTQRKYVMRAAIAFSMPAFRLFGLVMTFFVGALTVAELTTGGPSMSSALMLIVLTDVVISYVSCSLPGRRGRRESPAWSEAVPEAAS